MMASRSSHHPRSLALGLQTQRELFSFSLFLPFLNFFFSDFFLPEDSHFSMAVTRVVSFFSLSGNLDPSSSYTPLNPVPSPKYPVPV